MWQSAVMSFSGTMAASSLGFSFRMPVFSAWSSAMDGFSGPPGITGKDRESQ